MADDSLYQLTQLVKHNDYSSDSLNQLYQCISTMTERSIGCLNWDKFFKKITVTDEVLLHFLASVLNIEKISECFKDSIFYHNINLEKFSNLTETEQQTILNSYKADKFTYYIMCSQIVKSNWNNLSQTLVNIANQYLPFLDEEKQIYIFTEITGNYQNFEISVANLLLFYENNEEKLSNCFNLTLFQQIYSKNGIEQMIFFAANTICCNNTSINFYNLLEIEEMNPFDFFYFSIQYKEILNCDDFPKVTEVITGLISASNINAIMRICQKILDKITFYKCNYCHITSIWNFITNAAIILPDEDLLIKLLKFIEKTEKATDELFEPENDLGFYEYLNSIFSDITSARNKQFLLEFLNTHEDGFTYDQTL
ncbi:hypothetical protein TVAG_212290 [Trichomonas vaginalis G3]|uniref:Uncharacterized protein n=1 Tax=Trichomonas vaginalis (strain ATCC PRA-98 / G3) TaxID=412133 RepID=A2E2L9_TRIV3|nr:histidine kinase family [Trichomonas vaginalis G3]EAY13047.1 hypothetical protein TVAG_212290 [Trichomonas vaginalis G3]KAI5548236.1 histidine kinase family [Trichomonas vaginalis G3]|eukprot:XP_001325270.1 hypothetical protein [Trichomonas vaginalis G3]